MKRPLKYDRRLYDYDMGDQYSLGQISKRTRTKRGWEEVVFDDGTTASGIRGKQESYMGIETDAVSDVGRARWLPALHGIIYVPVDPETGEELR